MTEYKRIYLDTSPLVYFLNVHDKYYPCVKQVFDVQFDAEFFMSTVTELEYLVYPIRHRQWEKISEFELFMESMRVNVLSIDRAVSRKASEIRAQYPHFKTIDAIQLACATLCDCDVFFTNDKQLKQFSGIHCLLVDDLVTNP